MKNILSFYIFLFILTISAFAEEKTIPEFNLDIEKDGSVLLFKATPPEGHHFNLKSPYKAEKNNSKLKLYRATAQLIQYNLAKSLIGAKDVVTLTIFICDESNSYCVKQTKQWSKEGAMGTATAPTSAKEWPGASSIREKDEFGFILNNPDAAFAIAKTTGKPLLIDFYAIWCPPCNELDEIVYPSAEFQDLKKEAVLLKMDADSPASWKLKSRYEIKGYPTVLIAKTDGSELSRIVGFIPLKEFLGRIHSALKQDSSARSSPEQLASAAFYREDWSKSRELYAELVKKNATNEELKQRLSMSGVKEIQRKVKEKNGSRDEFIEKLEKAITDFPNTVYSMESAIDLAETYGELENKDKQKQILTKGMETVKFLLKTKVKNGEIAGSEYSEADLYQQLADFYEQLEMFDEAKSAFNSAVKIYNKKIKSSKNKNSRGIGLELAYCLWKSGNNNKADKLYEKFEKLFSKEFTFYYAHSRMLFHLTDFKRAVSRAENAFQYSYGDNKLRATDNLANIYSELGDKQKAISLIDQTLKETVIPSDSKIRSLKYIENLKKLKSKLSG